MPCLFCQRGFSDDPGRGRTREHVFAEWMVPYLKSPEGPGTQVRWNTTRDDPRYNETSYQAYPAQQAVQGVCQECNSGWLSRIQTDVKPALLGLLQSTRRRTLSEATQAALSRWAFRAVLVVGAKAGEAQVPAKHLHDFYESRVPPDSSRIWMTPTGHRRYTYLDHRILKIRKDPADEPPPSANGFATLVSVGHVAFYVLSWTDTKPRGGISSLFNSFEDALVTVHPSRGPVIWPPRMTLTHEGLDKLANVIGVWDK